MAIQSNHVIDLVFCQTIGHTGPPQLTPKLDGAALNLNWGQVFPDSSSTGQLCLLSIQSNHEWLAVQACLDNMPRSWFLSALMQWQVGVSF